MRAITMFLASPDVRVLGITVSPGALNADSVYSKVKSLLTAFHHEGLPVAINRMSTFRSPDFTVALNTSWGRPVKMLKINIDARGLIKDILKNEQSKISFICLGGMSTAASMIADEDFVSGVKQIVWSGDGVAGKNGFNYSIDKAASDKVLKGKIPVVPVNAMNGVVFYDETFLKSVAGVKGVYAECISSSFNAPVIRDHSYSYEATDEMVPVFLHYQSLFRKDEQGIYTPLIDSLGQIRKKALNILAGETVQKNQVIRYFPEDPAFYFGDVEGNVKKIIDEYGKEEWVSGVIANELHRHLGTYAIIGVKMGIRAREYFNTGVDEFSAVSFAGSVPPLSCMNDGIQVSTGATPGHGLLTVINVNTLPSVEFTYMNHKIRLTLKPEIAEKISGELKEINFVYGLDSNIYWELVRKNTIKYWLEMDRHEIFEIEEM